MDGCFFCKVLIMSALAGHCLKGSFFFVDFYKKNKVPPLIFWALSDVGMYQPKSWMHKPLTTALEQPGIHPPSS